MNSLCRKARKQCFCSSNLISQLQSVVENDSFEEFQKWYGQPTGQNVQTVIDAAPSWVSLKEVRRLTSLEQYDVEDVFEELFGTENVVLLERVFRQTDATYQKMLSQVRVGRVTRSTVGRLEECEREFTAFLVVLSTLLEICSRSGSNSSVAVGGSALS